jgi:hypothetical protein
MSIVNQVLMTTDYDLFQNISGNRHINKLHLNRLKTSMQEKYLAVPIIVNDKYQIIDGQHRYEAAKDLGKPIYYIKIDGLKLPDIHRLNTNSKNWGADDYLDGYVELGYPEYIRYKAFKEKYKFGHDETKALLSGTKTADGHQVNGFKEGSFRIKDLKEAEVNAEKILLVGEYYDGIKRRSFVKAMIELFRNVQYNHAQFLKKLKFQRDSLIDCTNAKQYITLIEEIYNYKSAKKVNLRF